MNHTGREHRGTGFDPAREAWGGLDPCLAVKARNRGSMANVGELFNRIVAQVRLDKAARRHTVWSTRPARSPHSWKLLGRGSL